MMPNSSEAARLHEIPFDPSPEAVAGSPEGALDAEHLIPATWIEWFVIAQTAIPAVLFIPGMQVFRLPVRVGAYAIALGAFGVWWFVNSGRSKVTHPSRGWLVGVTMWLGLMIFHPSTNSLQAGIAQSLLYVAVFCPLLWAPTCVERPRELVRILAVLLVCNGIN